MDKLIMSSTSYGNQKLLNNKHCGHIGFIVVLCRNIDVQVSKLDLHCKGFDLGDVAQPPYLNYRNTMPRHSRLRRETNKHGHATHIFPLHKGSLMDYEIDIGRCNNIILITESPTLILGFNIRHCNWRGNCFCRGNIHENGM